MSIQRNELINKFWGIGYAVGYSKVINYEGYVLYTFIFKKNSVIRIKSLGNDVLSVYDCNAGSFVAMHDQTIDSLVDVMTKNAGSSVLTVDDIFDGILFTYRDSQTKKLRSLNSANLSQEFRNSLGSAIPCGKPLNKSIVKLNAEFQSLYTGKVYRVTNIGFDEFSLRDVASGDSEIIRFSEFFDDEWGSVVSPTRDSIDKGTERISAFDQPAKDKKSTKSRIQYFINKVRSGITITGADYNGEFQQAYVRSSDGEDYHLLSDEDRIADGAMCQIDKSDDGKVWVTITIGLNKDGIMSRFAKRKVEMEED